MRRIRSEAGFSSVIALMIMSIVLIFGIGVLGFSLRSMQTSQKDRSSARALAAADAALDRAQYLMNRALLSEGADTLLGFTNDTLRNLTCLTANTNGAFTFGTADLSTASTVSSSNGDAKYGWCDPGSNAVVYPGDGSKGSWQTSSAINLGGALQNTLVRRVLATGTAGGVTRRIEAIYRLDINTAHTTTLFKRWSYVECTVTKTGTAIDSGCPDAGY